MGTEIVQENNPRDYHFGTDLMVTGLVVHFKGQQSGPKSSFEWGELKMGQVKFALSVSVPTDDADQGFLVSLLSHYSWNLIMLKQ